MPLHHHSRVAPTGLTHVKTTLAFCSPCIVVHSPDQPAWKFVIHDQSQWVVFTPAPLLPQRHEPCSTDHLIESTYHKPEFALDLDNMRSTYEREGHGGNNHRLPKATSVHAAPVSQISLRLDSSSTPPRENSCISIYCSTLTTLRFLCFGIAYLNL
jgi:hypothetical protein